LGAPNEYVFQNSKELEKFRDFRRKSQMM